MKILIFEIRKNFLKRYLFVTLCLLTLINIFMIYDYYKENHVFSTEQTNRSEAFWNLYKGKFKGKITNEKINALMEIYTPLYQICAVERSYSMEYDPETYTGYTFGDYRMLDLGFVRPMEYSYMYRNHALEIADKAMENLEFFRSVDNNYQYRSNLKIASLFGDRQVTDFYHTEMYENLFRYDFSSFLILLMSILALVPVFVAEKETEMNLILSTSKKGGKETINAKILSSFLYVIIISAWFYIFDFLAFSYFYGLTGLNNQLYALKDFMLTPLNVRMWEFIILSAVVKIIGLMAVSSMILFLSSIFRRALLPYILSLATVFLLMLFNEFAKMKFINPIELIANRELFKNTGFIKILDFPVHKFIGVILSVIFLAGAFVLATKMTSKKNASLGRMKERK
ncbi:hypothetical protein KQI41_10790 [Tissierella pigra]|uniref:hypothetical protein n=1 Tax=Tissierella pigra TaxID=2607614 RepID=UPI001C101706|nr:hypothetical protein [Tissierella pigra]MBU5426897.1 hypothetical protein [Tissierella pigra]